jgi:hypothetical protein
VTGNIHLQVRNKIVTSPRRTCNIFNKTLIETVSNLMLDKKPPETSNNITSVKDSLVLLEITGTELIKLIQSMKNKKSAGLDDISPYLLKKSVPHIIKPLLELVNASIREGIFSSKLKKSVVKPIYKYGEIEEAINYWLITLVPALSKVLEKVMANQLLAFLEKRYVFNKSQFGFRKKSTKDAIATIIENRKSK